MVLDRLLGAGRWEFAAGWGSLEEEGRLLAMGLDFTSLKVTVYSREGC